MNLGGLQHAAVTQASGFDLAQENTGRFVASSASCRVVMEYEKHHFAAWIEPQDLENNELTYPALNVELIAICEGHPAEDMPVADTENKNLDRCDEEYCSTAEGKLPALPKGRFSELEPGRSLHQRTAPIIRLAESARLVAE